MKSIASWTRVGALVGMARLRRVGATATIAAIIGSGLAIAPASSANANECRIRGYFCGTVVNVSGRAMAVAQFRSDLPHSRCVVWNDSNAGVMGYPNRKWENCVTRRLDSGYRIGGNGVDIDGFTMVNNRYDLFYGNVWRKRLAAGEWTKISSFQTVICTRPIFGSTPNCRVYVG